MLAYTKKWSCLILVVLTLNACKKVKSSQIETKQFHNAEMIEYCLPIPKKYSQNHEIQLPKANHQFVGENKNLPTITLKGNLLNVSFSTLQETIKTQLANMKESSKIINIRKNSISYVFELNNQLFFEKKWLLDDSTATVTITCPNKQQTDFFEQLKSLYISASPKCK